MNARNRGGNTKFPRVYNATDFGITANVTCQPSQWTAIGTVTVGAGQMIAFGVGGLGSTDSREVCYIKLDNASDTQLTGKVRLVLSDPNGIRKIVVAEQRTELLSASQYDKTQGFLLGEYPAKAQEDSKLIIEFYPDDSSAVTIDYDGTDTKLLIPVTVYQ